MRATIFHKEADFEAFERILAEDESWIEASVKRLGLESTLRPRGRPQVRFPDQDLNNES